MFRPDGLWSAHKMVAMATMHSEKKLTLLSAQFIKLVRYIDCCIDKGLEGERDRQHGRKSAAL